MVVAHAGPVPGQGTWETTLQARDLNGDSEADAFYDTDLGITWLRNANANGQMNWWDAMSWASGLGAYGTTGWRLPTSDQCRNYDCVGSEMGHLWYLSLGNVAPGPIANTGEFQNFETDVYWSGTGYQQTLNFAMYMYMISGAQDFVAKDRLSFAMAVHDGDIGTPIPEPATIALVGAALFGVAATRRRKLRGCGQMRTLLKALDARRCDTDNDLVRRAV